MIHYVPPPTEFAVLAVRLSAQRPRTPFADHLIQSNAERRRYPARPASVPGQHWSNRYVSR